MYREIYFERNEKVAAKINTRIYKYLFTKLENLHSVTSQLQLMVPMAYYEICETIRTIRLHFYLSLAGFFFTKFIIPSFKHV